MVSWQVGLGGGVGFSTGKAVDAFPFSGVGGWTDDLERQRCSEEVFKSNGEDGMFGGFGVVRTLGLA
jgi:hypothetical protein